MPPNKLKVLVLSDFQGNDANVIRDYLYSFHQYSRHEFFYLHRWKKNNCARLRQLDFDSFDAVVLFWDYYWLGIEDAAFDCCIPDWAIDKIGRANALKILFMQDEYRDVRKANRIMARLGVNLMFTCVAEKDHELFYPKALVPTLRGTYTVLTGYVSRYLVDAVSPALDERPIDIGYRSRSAPYHLGSVAQEKAQIAHSFERFGKQYGFSTNISVREQDRLYGEQWLDFLRSTRFSLGTESGASVVDFDGDIRRKTTQYLKAHPDATFDEVKSRFFADVDGKPVIQTISPRIFEAAAFGNTLVLHEGDYAKILQPDVHFISVKKDYSNIEDVVARMRDRALCSRLATAARTDLVQSGQYDYRRFVQRFDAILDDHRAQPTRQGNPSRVLFYAANYLHQDCIIPLGNQHHVLHHPVHLVQLLKDRVPDFLTVSHSVDLIVALLAGNQALRKRLAIWLRNRGEAPVSLAGVARDLRILGLLQRVRSQGSVYGPAFKVTVSQDTDTNRLLLRSVPVAEAGDAPCGLAAERTALAGTQPFAGLVWDHGKIGDSFVAGPARDRFFSIFINAKGLYSFDHFHAMFASAPEQERAVLQDLLFQPPASQTHAEKFVAGTSLLALLGYAAARKSAAKLVSLASKAFSLTQREPRTPAQ